MRAYPAGWPADSADMTLPDVYLHVIGSSWPPASTFAGEALPAGWAPVTDWEIECDLVARLLPGQVTQDTQLAVATAKCTIPQPTTGLLAPWRGSTEQTPGSSSCELVASFDGYNGSTAFVLGRFLLDPMKGRMSEPFLSLTMVQDIIKLRRPHTVPSESGLGMVPGFGFTPSSMVAAQAALYGYGYSQSGPLSATLLTSYFPGTTDELTALQTLVAASLGAMFLSIDGTTIKVRDPDYLQGAGTIVSTIQVEQSLEDLSWEQDPNSTIDRIELTYIPYNIENISPVIWTAPKGFVIAGNTTVVYTFDPGRPVEVPTGYSTLIDSNTSAAGGGSGLSLPVDIVANSSGSLQLTITNTTASTRYLVDPSGSRALLTAFRADSASAQSAKTLTWGVAAAAASNALQIDLGRNIQDDGDAAAIMARIVNRVRTATYILDDIDVVPDLRRELSDINRLQLPAAGFDSRVLTTGIRTAGTAGNLTQTLTVAAMPFTVSDFNTAMNTAHPGWTIADFNTFWNTDMPGATVADFNTEPLNS